MEKLKFYSIMKSLLYWNNFQLQIKAWNANQLFIWGVTQVHSLQIFKPLIEKPRVSRHIIPELVLLLAYTQEKFEFYSMMRSLLYWNNVQPQTKAWNANQLLIDNKFWKNWYYSNYKWKPMLSYTSFETFFYLQNGRN